MSIIPARQVSLPLAALLLTLLLAAGCGGEQGSGNPGDAPRETTAEETTTGAEDLPDRTLMGRIPQPELETRPVVIEGSGGEVRVEAEIADDSSEQARGLMAREELGENEGMLFVFDEESLQNFVMDNTLIPLSIAFIDSGGRIVNILDMEPLTPGPYPSEEPAQYALEVNQGFFDEHGVEVGDEVELPGGPDGP